MLAPSAPEGLFWETNIPPYDIRPNEWFNSSDKAMLDELLGHCANNTLFGACDQTHLFATGISSGGYETSRLAVDMAARFRAVVIASGAYMTCGGPLCDTPSSVPQNHPPTLFLHGLIDPVVPYYTMEVRESCVCVWVYSSALLISLRLAGIRKSFGQAKRSDRSDYVRSVHARMDSTSAARNCSLVSKVF